MFKLAILETGEIKKNDVVPLLYLILTFIIKITFDNLPDL